MTKKSKSTKRPVSRVRDTRSNNPRVGVRPIDPDQARYNNQTIRLCLVFKGNPNLTSAFSTSTIPAKSFIVGRQHDKTHESIKQAIYNAIESTLSRFGELDSIIKARL